MFDSAALSGGTKLKWEIIVGPIAAAIALALITWCVCKWRINGKNPFLTQRFCLIIKRDSYSIILGFIFNKLSQIKQ